MWLEQSKYFFLDFHKLQRKHFKIRYSVQKDLHNRMCVLSTHKWKLGFKMITQINFLNTGSESSHTLVPSLFLELFYMAADSSGACFFTVGWPLWVRRPDGLGKHSRNQLPMSARMAISKICSWVSHITDQDIWHWIMILFKSRNDALSVSQGDYDYYQKKETYL